MNHIIEIHDINTNLHSSEVDLSIYGMDVFSFSLYNNGDSCVRVYDDGNDPDNHTYHAAQVLEWMFELFHEDGEKTFDTTDKIMAELQHNYHAQKLGLHEDKRKMFELVTSIINFLYRLTGIMRAINELSTLGKV